MANLGNTIINGILRVNGKVNSSDVISAPSFTGALPINFSSVKSSLYPTESISQNEINFFFSKLCWFNSYYITSFNKTICLP